MSAARTLKTVPNADLAHPDSSVTVNGVDQITLAKAVPAMLVWFIVILTIYLHYFSTFFIYYLNNQIKKGVTCQNLEDPPYYRCGACPAGTTGNGTFCSDVDEVCLFHLYLTSRLFFSLTNFRWFHNVSLPVVMTVWFSQSVRPAITLPQFSNGFPLWPLSSRIHWTCCPGRWSWLRSP